MSSTEKTRVVIVGSGVAAVEAILALEDVAADVVSMTVLTPKPTFELRALTVATPFTKGRERRHYPLAPLIHRCGATLVEDELAKVVPADKQVVTASGETIDYDALIVAVGARPRAAYEHSMTFGAEPLAINGLLADIEEGYSRRIAFVVPPGVCWPLPAYELALMTRRQAHSMSMDPAITIVTPEAAPLAIFGEAASNQVADLLTRVGIKVRIGQHASVGASGRIGLMPARETLDFQRIVALPVIDGPRIPGLPNDQDGFVPVDEHARVLDLRDVYCVGDAANYPIKQGGLATQQADAAALHVAALAGAAVTATPFRPVLRGRLMTGGTEQFFMKPVHKAGAAVSETPLWWPPTKVSGRYLTPWLAAEDPGALPSEPVEPAEEIEHELPLDPTAARRAILSLSSLGPPPPVHRMG